MMRPIRNREEYLQLRDSQKNTALVQALRRGERTTEEKAAMKRRLLQMNYSCLPNEDGTLRGSKAASNTVGMDVDFHPEDPQYDEKMMQVPDLVLSKKDELGLLMLERSATKGYHIVFRRRTDLSQEENLQWASALLGVEYDKGAKDITRVFFTTTASQEDLIFLQDEVFEGATRYEGQGTRHEVRNTSQEPETENSHLPGKGEGVRLLEPSFGPIPYEVIIERWWKDVKGRIPFVGERHASLLDLCKNLAYITEFNRDLLLKIMPRLDIPEQELTAIVDDTLKYVHAHRSTKIPNSMYSLIKQLEQEYEAVSPLKDDSDEEDEEENIEKKETVPQEIVNILPPGIREYVSKAPQKLKAAYCHALLVEWATLTTRLRATYLTGQTQNPSLLACIVGEPSSGKNLISVTSSRILKPLTDNDARMEQLNDEWDDAVKQKGGGAKDMPLRPKLPLFYSDGDITPPEMLNVLKFNKGHHMIICSDEIDSIAKTRHSNWEVMSEFLRKAFDNGRWGQQRAGSNAVRGHAEVFCNFLAGCTEDRMRRYFESHVENGLASRFIFSPIETVIGEPLPIPIIIRPAALRRIEALQRQAIYESFSIQESLDEEGNPTVKYEVMPERHLNLRFLNDALEQWLEKEALQSRKECSKARDQFRKRAAVIAFRSGMVAFWLWGAKHTSGIHKKVIDFSLWMADWVVEKNIRYFVQVIEKKNKEKSPAEQRPNYAKVYDQLPDVFDKDMVEGIVENSSISSASKLIIYRWTQNRLIRKFKKQYYKIGSIPEKALNDTQEQ